MTLYVPTAEGRILEVLVAGPEDGFPLVFHQGTPQGAVPFAVLERPATARNLRVISYSRPGYGGSTPRVDGSSSATVTDDASHVITILDHLDHSTFVTLGWSGVGHGRSPVPPSCPAAASRRRVVPESRRPTAMGSTSPAAWDLRTSRSTPRHSPVERRSRSC